MILPEEIQLADKVGKSIGSRWALIETEDVVSYLYLWLVENEKYLIRWREHEGDGELYVSLRRAAAKYCNEKNKEMFKDKNRVDYNFYSLDKVYNILKSVFDINLTDYEINNDTENMAYNIASDFLNVFNGRPEIEKEVLRLRYHKGYSFSDIADYYGISTDAAEKRVERAVHRLHNSLAGHAPVWITESNSKEYNPYWSEM